MMGQAPVSWNPHKKLEYLKVVIRSVIAGVVGMSRKDPKEEISDLEVQLNDMKVIKEKACILDDEVIGMRKVDLIEGAIVQIQNGLSVLREKQSAETSFRARAAHKSVCDM